MKSSNCEFGHQGEELAASFLQNKRYKIIDRNWHAGRLGEIDIVALSSNELFFVEVKTRHHTNQGWPEESVTPTKIKHLMRASESYLNQHPQLPKIWHFEVVAIVLSADNKIFDIKHYQNIHLT